MKQAIRSQLLAKNNLSSGLQTAAQYFRSLWQEEDGQDMVEYSLLLSFIAVASVAMLSSAKGTVASLWTAIDKDLSSAVTAAS